LILRYVIFFGGKLNISMYMYVKTITISGNVYCRLLKPKKKGEDFSLHNLNPRNRDDDFEVEKGSYNRIL